MKLLKIITLAFLATFILTACGGGSPEAVAEKYCKAVMAADVKAAVKYATADQAEELTEILSDSDTREFVLNTYKDATLTLSSSNIAADETSAEVVYDVETAVGSEKGNIKMRVGLIKEGGGWKVDKFR